MQNLGMSLLKRPGLLSAIKGSLAIKQTVRQQLRCFAAVKAELDRDQDAKSEKAKAADKVMRDLNSKFGKGSIMRLGEATALKIERVPTGALTLDVALGGGFPRGRIIEIYGPESSGKTTLALQAIASVQQNGGIAAFIDAEHAFDPQYAARAGVDVQNLIFSQPDCGENALEMVDNLVRSASVDIIAIDSVAALTPRAELEGEIGDTFVGTQARMMSRALSKLSANAGKCNTTIIFINQLRMKIGVMYGNPETTTGGQALKYYSSVRLDVRKTKNIDGPVAGEHVGVRVKAKITKNKVAPPFRVCEFDILFGSGISKLGSLVDAAEKKEVIQRKGSWYYFGERRLEQGREKTLQALKEDAQLRSQIEELTKKALLVEYGDPRAEEAGEEDEELPPLEDEGFPEEQGAATAA